ncbi:DUF6197 family protein [Streptomyces syringium]|uniref:DUF6197 family protein n=1 Tax=Streptomyces syringium TaxID=76729 RepID=UPI0033ECCDC8
MNHKTTHPGLAAVFRRAAEVITRNGFYQGHYFDDTQRSPRSPSELPVCTIGALRVAAGTAPQPLTPTDVPSIVAEAMAVLSARIESTIVDGDHEERIAQWSDTVGRTADEVVAEFLAAAEAVAA